MINNSFRNIAITGASGAIGKSFVKNLSEINTVETINVFSRSNEIFDSEKVFNHVVKYENENDLIEAANIASFKNNLDLVIVANGILHNENIYPEKKISDLTEEKFKELFFVNTILPSIIAKHFIPKMSHSNKSIFAFMSARVGSISDNKLGGWYAYRSSK
ncbi:MAG: short-chain dehydrogenase, partial [SAR116 cluster bacterium]|nr:short-chain dehydrogenase [SAR116 cluster bacterium]